MDGGGSRLGTTSELPHQVLVVDDEADLRTFFRTILEQAGYLVDTAEGGHRVLEMFPERRPDLMILDLGMPELDGWEVIERLQGRGRLPPVLLLSERGGDPRRGRFRECIAACLFKPVKPSEFLGTCRRILDLSERAEGFPEERRREARRPLIVEVTVLSSEGLPTLLGSLVDLSVRGFQLELGVPLKPGDPIRALLPIPGTTPLDLEGRIRWCKALPGGFVVGGELGRIDPDQVLILEALLHPFMSLSA